jgi:hypothetical protein
MGPFKYFLAQELVKVLLEKLDFYAQIRFFVELFNHFPQSFYHPLIKRVYNERETEPINLRRGACPGLRNWLIIPNALQEDPKGLALDQYRP